MIKSFFPILNINGLYKIKIIYFLINELTKKKNFDRIKTYYEV